ncbi:hypothetical protein MKK55_18035 [Methylobacterium sp. J-059]|uniref:hypothetical protein n=1 Tax=Methylobacterium sp. J-059 TaxID=2836643 RepID=UPI001FBA6EF3|nr:hypothetical protein [Methylobacterium sp. J-059]MCJ2040833.1 hypothetical protein [Methylobacterium sp. J-059]
MVEPTNIAALRFDSTAAWASLTRDQQELVGRAALDLVVARGIAEHAPDPASRAGYEAERLALGALLETVLDANILEDHHWVEPAQHGSDFTEVFRLPEVIGPVCHACGCSQEDACGDGCGWATEMICTACHGKAEDVAA